MVIQRCLGVVCSILFLGLMLACSGSTPGPTSSTPKAPLAKADDALQAKRLKVIHEAQSRGLIKNLDVPAKFPHLWVTPAFMRLDHDQKKAFAELAFAYSYEIPQGTKLADMPDGAMLVLKHTKTGNSVGQYSPETGLMMD